VDPPAGALVLLDLRRAKDRAALRPIDDVVMGGRSRSGVLACDGGAAFAGEVSLADGGGFASIRSEPRGWDLSGRTALVLRVRGDGRRYRLNLRDDDGFDGVTHQAAFEPPREWAEVRVPLAALEPRFRGRPASGRLDLRRVETVGLLVSDRQAGPFRLELAWITAE
jgi:NADH dehydrogenase [ubiquinone] 1 alpha subcomplex assembly factor 1